MVGIEPASMTAVFCHNAGDRKAETWRQQLLPFEHLEFETRPDQLISYVLVQGDERVVLRFVPPDVAAGDGSVQEQFRFTDPDYVQMELGTMGLPEARDRVNDEQAARDEPSSADGGG